MFVEIIGELVVEVLAYGTYGFVIKGLKRIPIRWNEKDLKILTILLSITLWLLGAYLIICLLERVLP